MEIKKYIIIYLISLLLSNEKTEYQVTLYNIPMADVYISFSDTIYKDIKVIKLDFETQTNSFVSQFFKVDNKYQTIIKNNDFNIMSFEKLTYQPNVTNKIKTVQKGENILYENTKISIPKNMVLDQPLFLELTVSGYVSAASKGFLNRNETLDWDFVKRLRDMWAGKLLIKSVLHPDDAMMAVDCGADGIFVSNHAGNVNDTAITTWDALPEIVKVVGGRTKIIADTGIRRGSDVIKGLALGADVIAIGRATLYGLAAAGERGATRAIDILDAEIRRTMAVMGIVDIPSIGRDHIRLARELAVSGD